MSIYRGAGGSGDAVADSSSEATLVAQLVVEAETAEANASASATAAASSASAASASASAAATAETNAETAEANAETAEANAETAQAAAEAAQAAAEAAQLAAETAETNAETAETNAETAETNAETAATNAASSASAASTSATNASNSATAAATSATNASNSATASATSATNAASSATAASGSATAAASSASSASTSASNAATSETNAATSASTATTQAGLAATSASNAATSETNAASSASAASTSASNASTSASNAATSETNAASSATAAAASYDNFDDRYLGAKSSAPSVDNDGDALLTGALYYDTTSSAMKVWSGSSWLDAYASLSGALIATNNLSDLNDAATARTNLGVAIGTNVQAWDADLDTWATKTAPSGTVVGTSDTQTLTNKTLALGSNTVSGTLAEFNTAVTDADFASLAGTETLSNKTLAGVTNTGNLAFTGTGNRITGDFSNATVANRVAFQTSTTNGNTAIPFIPNGTATTSALFLYNGSDTANAAFLNINNSSSATTFNSTIAGTGTYLPMTFYTGGSERLRIDTSGNVGIGTSSPASKLSVGGNPPVAGAIAAVGSSGGIALALSDNVNCSLYIRTASGGAIFGTDGGGALRFATNGNTASEERMRIDTSGNVGIGTSSPRFKLSIGSITGASTATPDTIDLGATYSSTAGANPKLRLFWDGGVYMGLGISSSQLDYTVSGAYSHVWYSNGSERMRIDSVGVVTIGNSVGQAYQQLALNSLYPASGLISEVVSARGSIASGATSAASVFLSRISTENATFTLPTLRHFHANPGTFGASSIVTNQYGFLAEGTLTGATNNYAFFGAIAAGTGRWNFYANGTAANYFAGQVQLAAGSAGTPALGAFGDTNTGMFFPAADTIAFAEGGTEAMRIDSSGNVGIGTSSPSTYGKFVVSGSSNTDVGTFIGNQSLTGSTPTYKGTVRIIDNPTSSTGASGGIEFLTSTFGSGYGWKMASIDSSGVHLTFATRQNSSSWTEAMRIDQGGNLQFNSGYGSAATAYGCRAWVNFNGTGTVAIRSSGNVSSITDNGTGDYTVNFTNVMPDVNYSPSIAISVGFDAGFSPGGVYGSSTANPSAPPTTMTTSALRIAVGGKYSVAYTQDAALVSVQIFR